VGGVVVVLNLAVGSVMVVVRVVVVVVVVERAVWCGGRAEKREGGREQGM